jgi:tetratricopeptide (TPR) repeat protein
MQEQLAYTTNDLGYVYQANADTKNMNRVLEMATALWRELGNLPMLTDSLTSYANNMVFAGDLDRALSVSQEARALSESLNNPWSESFTLFTPCFVYWFRMDVAKALDAMRRCIALGRDVGFVGGMVTMSNYQAQLLLALGRTDAAQDVMQGIRQTAERNIPLFLSGASAAEAMIAMTKGNLDEAEQLLRPFADDEPPFDLMNCFMLENSLCEYWRQTAQLESVDHYAGRMVSLLKERRLVTFLPQFLQQQARALLGLGKVDEAWEALLEALALYNRTGTRWKKVEVVALQADVAARRGEEKKAEGLRREAQELRQWIREQAAAADIKVSPLQYPA